MGITCIQIGLEIHKQNPDDFMCPKYLGRISMIFSYEINEYFYFDNWKWKNHFHKSMDPDPGLGPFWPSQPVAGTVFGGHQCGPVGQP